MTPEIQASFDYLFPEHKGHGIGELVKTSLMTSFRCSCHSKLVVDLGYYVAKTPGRLFAEYLWKLQAEAEGEAI